HSKHRTTHTPNTGQHTLLHTYTPPHPHNNMPTHLHTHTLTHPHANMLTRAAAGPDRHMVLVSFGGCQGITGAPQYTGYRDRTPSSLDLWCLFLSFFVCFLFLFVCLFVCFAAGC